MISKYKTYKQNLGSRLRPADRIQSPIGLPESGAQILYFLSVYTIPFICYICYIFDLLHNHFDLFALGDVKK